ncbi:hypothetical protein D7Y05_16055 [bacterium 1XD42-54]|nr:hypothetical protein D7Y05_16055 [bacterium 1XD42-54]
MEGKVLSKTQWILCPVCGNKTRGLFNVIFRLVLVWWY